MRKQIEEQCMKTISEFYCNKNYDFFDYLEDRVIYYSPGKDHIIQGREELCEYFKNLKNSLEFETGNARAKLINLKPGVFLINTELELKIIHKNGKTKIINQRIALALRQTRTNGIMRETCPYIQISNLINTNAENTTSGFSPVEPAFDYETKKMIPFPGENGTVYYINKESVKYAESLKGVKCSVHTDCETFTANKLIKDITELLGSGFIRCHSGYVVNAHKVKSISPYKITLLTGEEIPVPVKKYTAVKKALSDCVNDIISVL